MGFSGRQRRFLRSLGHSLRPVVHIGKGGLTEAVVSKLSDELDAHELIKVKVLESCPEEARQTAREAASETSAVLAQTVGRIFLLYRARTEDPTIRLPRR